MTNNKKNQGDRFEEAARSLDADQSDDVLDRIMGKLDLTKKPVTVPEPKHEKRDE